MTYHDLAPVALFALTMIGTPGPNNVMLTASGARFGYRATLAPIAGILVGSASLYIAVAAGLGAVFQTWPAFQWALRLIGAAYLLYLGWHIATAPPPDTRAHDTARPWSFAQAAAFQYANPKVWVVGLTLSASFLPNDPALWRDATTLAAVMSFVGVGCLSFWAAFGALIGRLLYTDSAWRLFNRTMGALTAACVFFVLS